MTLSHFIDKGTSHYASSEGKRRVKILNVSLLIALTLATPLIIVINYFSGLYIQMWISSTIYLVFLLCLYLNRTGRNQLASLLTLGATMLVMVSVVYFSHVQLAAPYVAFVVTVGSLHLIRNRTLKHFFMITSLLLFLIINYYQVAFLPFDLFEYIPTIPILILTYVGLTFAEREINRYQSKIVDQNEQLQSQNQTIKQQSQELIKSEKQRHEQEILLKQKDLDTILANVSFQEKLNDNIIRQLSKSLKGQDLAKDVKQLIHELRGQVERIDKLSLLQENLDEVNASLYARLLEKHPDLTKSELELCTLIRLGLSVKEVATFRGSTENSTMVLRSRLRKKLGLQDQNLSTYLLNF